MKVKVLFSVLGFLLVIFSYGFQPQPVSAQVPNISLSSIPWDWYDCSLSSTSDTSSSPSDSDLPFSLPLALKTRFPFDLVYPVNPQDLSIDSECLSTSLWGIQRDLCAPMQIAGIAKNVFLFSYVLKSFLSF